MDPKELRGLVEAYSEVYAPQEVDEAVKGASPHAMQMRKDAASERKAGAKDRLSPSEGKANAAKMQRDIKFYDKITKKTKPSVVGMTHEEVDIFDTILEYLVAEGYADNNREALHIMANSSEEQILEYRKLAAAAVGGMMALNMMKPGMPAPKVKTPTPEREKTELVSKAKTGKEDKESKQYIQNRLERDRELGISK